MSLPISQIVLKKKESYSSICDDVVENPNLRALRKKKLR